MKPSAGRHGGGFGVGIFAAALLAAGVPGTWSPPAHARDAKAVTSKTPPRDWAKAPAIAELDTAEDVYALGDIHGDYARLVALLAAAGLIDGVPKTPADVVWKGGKAVLVCTGDLIDKDDHALPAIALLQGIQAAASRAGGRVIVTMGNHEAEFLADPEGDKKDQDFVAELKAAGITPDQVAAGTDTLGIGRFFLTLPFAARVNDWFFAHAGNTRAMSIRDLASALRSGIDADGYGAPILSAGDSLLEARMHPEPWWPSREALAAGVEALGGVNHLVFGHQPGAVTIDGVTVRKKGTLVQLYDGLVFLIDVGMSKGIGDSAGFLLRVHKGGTEATVIAHDGKTKTIWTKER